MRILKYKIYMRDTQVIEMPVGAKILCVQMQHGICCIWAQCDETKELFPRTIVIYGTGHQMPNNPGQYLGTIQLEQGALIFHFYEQG